MSDPVGKALIPTPEAEVRVRRQPQADLDFAGLLRLCEELVATHFLPRAVDTAGKAAALILTGREMGLGPMASIRSLAIVDGKPVLAADLQLGIFKRAGGQAVWRRLDEKGATLWLRHPNGDEHTETFTADDALRAGLLNKDNWRKYPKAMYRSRAITAGLKSVGFEPLAGTYDPEELEPLTPAGRPEGLEAPGSGPAAPQAPEPEAGKAEAAPAAAEPVAGQGDDVPRIPGGPTKWDGNGGKLITDPTVSAEELGKIRDWFYHKDAKKNAALITAMDAELERRATED